MNCPRCQKEFDAKQGSCPHCGEKNVNGSGLFQTSTVLISQGGSDQVYRSVEEVPAALRTRLLKSTNGANSATIVIADQRGRKEIAKAMRKLPGPAQRRLLHSVFSSQTSPEVPHWLTPRRKKAMLALVLMLALAIIALAFRAFSVQH